MRIQASVRNAANEHEAVVSTGGQARRLEIPPKAQGQGSSVNGGELLLLALATCYCNDVYREAARRSIVVRVVEVTADAEFATEGQAATSVTYHVRATAVASESEILDLLRRTDRVAEIQNTVRASVPVTLTSVEAVVVA
jgi:organic hydroperoxide reductase OsmC/OhrA